MPKKNKSNKDLTIYTLEVAFNEETEEIEYIEEKVENEFNYRHFEGEYVYILDYYSDDDLSLLDDTLVIGES
tara:strand:- start:12572 stop:12787 length:216 start_codon:yes stop_codon:yes gene_type:complete